MVCGNLEENTLLHSRPVHQSKTTPYSSPFWHRLASHVVNDEGGAVADLKVEHDGVEQCQKTCDGHSNCNSFVACTEWDGVRCYMKDRRLSGHEPHHPNTYCASYFKSPEPYVPADTSLARPSRSQVKTFYMYRAQSGDANYPPQNVNTASLGGVLWYLHNEVIFTCDGSGFDAGNGKWGDRKFAIDRIKRYKITMKATEPLRRKGMNFAVLKSFDSGEDTGPHRIANNDGHKSGYLSDPEWGEFGFNVGCGNLGEFPHQDWTSGKNYPSAIWYSLPGKCPQLPYFKETEQCRKESPGGLCAYPTGQGNCTYSYEEAGFIMLDELVGIKPRFKDRAEFCTKCGKEGNINEGGGCGVNFWAPNINDRHENSERVRKTGEAFDKKYPHMTKTQDLHTPRCDFKQRTYGISSDAR
eukprot:TRINITY_DN14932_c0_g1_i2.p1 TRINITY_DN14932_c0_g1~~TRINITY_DN14932_c0_g1_i2.p1  ORF type:complete len:412 (-),score=80.70 TRINITY_DN14932_c0_g1_i2:328-1563(-)